jgi:alkanesulfonate monooxygenase
MALRFHWRLPLGKEGTGLTRALMYSRVATGLPDLEAQVAFCRAAEESGIDSLLTDFGASKPDSILLAAALGLATERIKFIVAYRSGLLAPATFVQQLNTLSALINGRFSLNIVAGHSPEEQRSYGDFLAHDERYARTEEFLAICHAFWAQSGGVNFQGNYYHIENGRLTTQFVSSERTSPEIFIGGSSPAAQQLAIKQGTCWMRLADAPAAMRASVSDARGHGIEVGVRLSVIVRPTREEAVRAAYALLESEGVSVKSNERERTFVQKSDSQSINAAFQLAENEWLTPYLWTGAVRTFGAPSLALVGTPAEVAAAIMEYREIGVTQFILAGWPKQEEMIRFGREVIPRIREMERAGI